MRKGLAKTRFICLLFGLLLIGGKGRGKVLEIGVHRILITGSEKTLEEIKKTLTPFLVIEPGSLNRENLLKRKINFQDLVVKCLEKGSRLKIPYSFTFPVEENSPVNIEYKYGNQYIVLLRDFSASLDTKTGGIFAEIFIKEYEEQKVNFMEALGLPASAKYTICTSLISPDGGITSVASGVWSEPEKETGTKENKLDYFLLSSQSLDKGYRRAYSYDRKSGCGFLTLSLQHYLLLAPATTLQEISKVLTRFKGKWEDFLSTWLKKGLEVEYKGGFSFLMSLDSPISLHYEDASKELRVENLNLRAPSKDFFLASLSLEEKEKNSRQTVKFSGEVKVPLEGFGIIGEIIPPTSRDSMEVFVLVVRRW